MVDPQIVVLVVAGSSPVGHPTSFLDSDLKHHFGSVQFNSPSRQFATDPAIQTSKLLFLFPFSLQRLRFCPTCGALFKASPFTLQSGDETSSVNLKVTG